VDDLPELRGRVGHLEQQELPQAGDILFFDLSPFLGSKSQRPLLSGGLGASCPPYLQPFGDLDINLVYSLDSVVERLDRLVRLEGRLGREFVSVPLLGRLKLRLECRRMELTSSAGYSDRERSSIAADMVRRGVERAEREGIPS